MIIDEIHNAEYWNFLYIALLFLMHMHLRVEHANKGQKFNKLIMYSVEFTEVFAINEDRLVCEIDLPLNSRHKAFASETETYALNLEITLNNLCNKNHTISTLRKSSKRLFMKYELMIAAKQ